MTALLLCQKMRTPTLTSTKKITQKRENGEALNKNRMKKTISSWEPSPIVPVTTQYWRKMQ